ncbi:MAG: alanine--tRNA ligase [Nitrospiraceae bacterium]|jgi:alanyl-tRNA synthetase|nr:alanine--tRNA ligase [Nitrospiraceae bacterium]
MTSWEIRQKYLHFFESRGHAVTPSSSLIPAGDPTLLFTNAGMVPFKDIFLGLESPRTPRAVSIQKCIRAGGKHNDLDRVGFTRRHHTFFEMMGNFSFGDYFKSDAIAFAWEFLTRELAIDPKRLWITIFRDDDEAMALWSALPGVDPSRIVRLGEKDNFWQMGDTGPCGPCSEILVDQGPAFSCGSPDCMVGCDCDRYLEIWNLVFMQFNRSRDGVLTPLPRPSIDTGMGLERISAIMAGVASNYETDLFLPLIDSISQKAKVPYEMGNGSLDYAFRVIADHLRSGVFLLHEGIVPSNEGRGYVLRRILRRAIQFSLELELPSPVLSDLAKQTVLMMHHPYPELENSLSRIQDVLSHEEDRFSRTLSEGLPVLKGYINEVISRNENILPGEMLFKLHDTHGFPIDVCEDVARHQGVHLDFKGFEEKMEEQRERGRQSWVGKKEDFPVPASRLSVPVSFLGYERDQVMGEAILLIRDGKEVTEVHEGESVSLVLTPTVFYGEGGGQVGDRGLLRGPFGQITVSSAKKPWPGWILLVGTVTSGTVRKGELLDQQVDLFSRRQTEIHHTATHLLHAALRQVLGEHVRQAGSLVTPERLRFDFSSPHPVSKVDLEEIGALVNEWIRRDQPVNASEMEKSKAQEVGALAFFDEKYGDIVRVVSVEGTSTEFCGGTHARSTGQIGTFLILQESGVAAGIRRIEAVCGSAAYDRILYWKSSLEAFEQEMGGVKSEEALSRLATLKTERDRLQREVAALKTKLFVSEDRQRDKEWVRVNGSSFLFTDVTIDDPKDLRLRMDALKSDVTSGAVLLLGVLPERVVLLGWASEDVAKKFPVSDLVKSFSARLGGRGGGKPIWAEGGGPMPENLESLLAEMREIGARTFGDAFKA